MSFCLYLEKKKPTTFAIRKVPRTRAMSSCGTSGNAWCVVVIVMGFKTGAASINTMASEGCSPLKISPRASGTLPHSQTGRNEPLTLNEDRRINPRLDWNFEISDMGAYCCISVDKMIPRITNGTDS